MRNIPKNEQNLLVLTERVRNREQAKEVQLSLVGDCKGEKSCAEANGWELREKRQAFSGVQSHFITDTVLDSCCCGNKLPPAQWLLKPKLIYSSSREHNSKKRFKNQGVCRADSFWRLPGSTHSLSLEIAEAASISWLLATSLQSLLPSSHGSQYFCIPLINTLVITSGPLA